MMTAIREDNLVAAVIRGSALLLLLFCLAGLAFFSRRAAVGTLIGGLIGLANFLWMRSMLAKLLAGLPSRPARRALFGFVLRMTAVALAIYPPLASGAVSPLALLAGLSVIVITILLLSLHGVLRQRREGS